MSVWSVKTQCPSCNYWQIPMNYCPSCGHKFFQNSYSMLYDKTDNSEIFSKIIYRLCNNCHRYHSATENCYY